MSKIVCLIRFSYVSSELYHKTIQTAPPLHLQSSRFPAYEKSHVRWNIKIHLQQNWKSINGKMSCQTENLWECMHPHRGIELNFIWKLREKIYFSNFSTVNIKNCTKREEKVFLFIEQKSQTDWISEINYTFQLINGSICVVWIVLK